MSPQQEWWILVWLPERKAYYVADIVGAHSAPAALLRSQESGNPLAIARPVGDPTVPVVK
jgi:hypothetical protein